MSSLKITGCVTVLGAIRGLRVDELDGYLGMTGCSGGVWILQALELPENDGFYLAGNTSIATNKFDFEGKYDLKKAKERLDYPWHKGEWILKEGTRRRWRLSGDNSLVKIFRMDGITNGYPPANNPVAQWIIKHSHPLRARLLLTLYQPDDRVLA